MSADRDNVSAVHYKRSLRKLLPKDASVLTPYLSRPGSFALSAPIQGLTITITRCALTMFPNPMFMSVMLPSLNILNLLTDLFDLGFEVNDRVCNIGILALRAGSVSLAVKLLKQKSIFLPIGEPILSI